MKMITEPSEVAKWLDWHKVTGYNINASGYISDHGNIFECQQELIARGFEEYAKV